jgi:hypothetical protein
MPERIQLRRVKGWRKPEGAIVVSRPSKWGNPFTFRSDSPANGGLVRYQPSTPNEFEYEGRISAPGMRHDYWHPDGHITPYMVRYATRAEIVELFRRTLFEPDRGMRGAWPSRGGRFANFTIVEAQHELRGHDLCCWCAVGSPCHADVLLDLARGS